MNRIITSAGVCVMLAMGASLAQAQVPSDFDPANWDFGSRFDTDGEVPIWNPVMQKIKNGEPIIGGTIRATDPRTTAQRLRPVTTSRGSRCSTKR